MRMRAVLAAAGRGTRFAEGTPGVPKCTVDLGGTALIAQTVRRLRRFGIGDIAVVVGYRDEAVREALRGEQVHFFRNPFYARTNSIASLWFAREFLAGDVLVLNGDLYFEDGVLEEMLAAGESPVLFADRSRRVTGDYKLRYEEGLLLDHGKQLPAEVSAGEYVGAARIGRGFLPLFKERLEQLIGDGEHDLWWENVLYSFIGERAVHVREISEELFWAEVDTKADYERILSFLAGGKGEEEKGDGQQGGFGHIARF